MWEIVVDSREWKKVKMLRFTLKCRNAGQRRGNKVKMQLQKCFCAAPAADDRHYEAKLLC